MISWILVLAGAVAMLGIGVAIWSIIDTRRKYYEEYLHRKHNK